MHAKNARKTNQDLDIPNLKAQSPQPINLKLPTTIRSDCLDNELQCYDLDLSSYLLSEFTFGFKLGSEVIVTSEFHRNYSTLFKNPLAVDEKLVM